MSAPETSPLVATLRAKLAALPRVTESTSRFGARKRLAWRAGKREIAHLHSDTTIDIRLPLEERRASAGDERLLPRASPSDWVECRFASMSDTDFVVDLVARAARESR